MRGAKGRSCSFRRSLVCGPADLLCVYIYRVLTFEMGQGSPAGHREERDRGIRELATHA